LESAPELGVAHLEQQLVHGRAGAAGQIGSGPERESRF
jgi:hypothetical protein